MKDETVIAVVAMVCISAVLIVALIQKINGSLLALGLMAISGLAGYELKTWREKQ